MYVSIVEEISVVSFIGGYEAGTNNKCDFTKQLKDYLKEDLGIEYSSDGWPGQIKRYSKKFHVPWVVAFKQVALQVLASKENGSLAKALNEIVIERIRGLMARVDEKHPWFNEHWIQECSVFLATNNTWFINLWSNEEYNVLKSILDLVKNNQVFEHPDSFLPSKQLLELKSKFEALQSV